MLNLKDPEHCTLEETWIASNLMSSANWEMSNGK